MLNISRKHYHEKANTALIINYLFSLGGSGFLYGERHNGLVNKYILVIILGVAPNT